MNHAPEILSIDGAACRIFRDAPSWGGRKTAAFGEFRCGSKAEGEALLARLEQMLRAEGVEGLIGPMDGDTWHRYRVVSESDGSPPFFLEPASGAHDLEVFVARGFVPISSYVSTRMAIGEAVGTAPAVHMDGVTVAPWDGRDADRLVSGLFDMSASRFSRNAFFKPIDKAEFLKLYEPILPAVDPRLVLFARDETGLVGFLFGLPNRMEGASPRTALVKTYASLRRGVGHLLLERFHRTARDLNYASVIHALMHVDNVSLDRSQRHGGRIFRRYALMGKRLS